MAVIGYLFSLVFLVSFVGFLGFPKDSKLHKYCKNSLLCYDQSFNAIVLLGDPDETVSSRAGKGRLRGSKGWTLLANLLDLIDPGHSEDSIEWDEGTKLPNVPLKGTTNKSNKEDT